VIDFLRKKIIKLIWFKVAIELI